MKILMNDPAELVQTNVMKALLKIGGDGSRTLISLLFADAGRKKSPEGGKGRRLPDCRKRKMGTAPGRGRLLFPKDFPDLRLQSGQFIFNDVPDDFQIDTEILVDEDVP